jgi:ABC-type transport system involved in multi-copper enzyme maturation permease subunit
VLLLSTVSSPRNMVGGQESEHVSSLDDGRHPRKSDSRSRDSGRNEQGHSERMPQANDKPQHRHTTLPMLAILRLTWWHGLRQPTTLLVLALAAVALLLSWLFGAFNFDDNDRLRLLATSGVAVARLAALFLAVILASTTIHDELHSRTALTLFAKPLSRSAYLFGRSLGIWLLIGTVLLLLAGLHLGCFVYTAEYGFHGSVGNKLRVDEAWIPWSRLLVAHGLVWAEAATLTALATVLALLVPLTVNILLMSSLFVTLNLCGAADWHLLTPLPSLSIFSIDDALQFAQQELNPAYFALSLTYAGLYACGLLLLGAAWFQNQDIP